MQRVYVETSVWGMIPPGQNETLRQPTLEFFKECESRVFLACVADIVADEIADAVPELRTPILKRMAEINPIMLPMGPEVFIWPDGSWTKELCPNDALMMLDTWHVPS